MTSLDERIRAAADGLRDGVGVDAARGLARLRLTDRRRRTSRVVTLVVIAVLVAAAASWRLSGPGAAPEPAGPPTHATNGMLVAWSDEGLVVVGGPFTHRPPQVPTYRGTRWFRDVPGFQFSGDGTELFYTSQDHHVLAFDHEQGTLRDLGPCPSRQMTYGCPATVSPDGTRLAYPGRHAYVVRGVDGTSTLPLPELTTYAPAAWSPDGNRLAFTASENHTSPSHPSSVLYVVDADLTGLRVVVPQQPGTVTYGASWSPDGGSLAFVAGRLTKAGRIRFSVSAVELASGSVRTLASAGTCITCSGQAPSVAWSPDGELIAYTDYRGLLRAIPADGGDPVLLTTQPVIGPVAWQPVWGLASAP